MAVLTFQSRVIVVRIKRRLVSATLVGLCTGTASASFHPNKCRRWTGPRCCLKPHAMAGLLERRPEGGTTMRPWLLMFGMVLASIGLQAGQAQVTIDITEITCNQFPSASG